MKLLTVAGASLANSSTVIAPALVVIVAWVKAGFSVVGGVSWEVVSIVVGWLLVLAYSSGWLPPWLVTAAGGTAVGVCFAGFTWHPLSMRKPSSAPARSCFIVRGLMWQLDYHSIPFFS